MIGPNVNDATISGMTIKKLKIPIYTPIRSGGIEPARIAYGMARIDAHAMPTPIIEKYCPFGVSVTYIEIRPSPPMVRASACVDFLPSVFESQGSANAITKHTIE